MTKQISTPVTGAYLATGAMQSSCWLSAQYVAASTYHMPEAELIEHIVSFAEGVGRKFDEITSLEEFQGDYTRDVVVPIGDRIVRYISQQKALPTESDVILIARQVILAKELSTLPIQCPHCGSVKHKPSNSAPTLSDAMPNMIEHAHDCLECRKSFTLLFAPVSSAPASTASAEAPAS